MRTSPCLNRLLAVEPRYLLSYFSSELILNFFGSQGKAASRASAPPTTQRLDYSSIPGMDTGSPAFFRSMALASKRARAEKDTPSSSGSSSAARTAHRLFPDGGLLDYSA